ncbi:Uncharacterised protein [Klebsiella pneumoniae]|nr:Uncharacterised protein [Klebsiella pneumoniae]
MLFYLERMQVLLKLILVGWFTTQLGHLERVQKIIGIALLIMMEVKSFLVVHMQKFLYPLLDNLKHVMKKEISQNIITQYKLKSATYLLMFPPSHQMVA